jgi:phage gp29-like protein
LTEQEQVRGISLPPNKFVVHKYKAKSGHPSRAGLLRVCAWMYLFKNYDIKDWVTFAEIYGMPLRLGKYDSTATKEDKDALIQALVSLGTDAAGIISKNTEIEFVELVRSTGNVHQALAPFCNSEMSKAVLGQTLTTEVGAKGSYAASKTHGEVRQDLKEADCKSLAETIRVFLFEPLVRFNYRPDAPLPWMKFHYEPPEDLEKTANVYKAVVKEIGLPVAEDHLYERFGIPRPQPGERVLVVPGTGQALPMKNWLLPLAGRRVNDQAVIDNMVDNLVPQSSPLFRDLAEPVMRLIQEAGSLEEIRDRLAEVYAEMDTTELEDLIAKALFVTDLYGRWRVIG